MSDLLSKNGGQFRTRTMKQEQAERFASCLRANSLFTGVQVYESSRAKSEARWLVVYHPTNPERIAAILDRASDQREAKAEEEGHGFLWLLDKRGGEVFFWCSNPISGGTYETTTEDCSCPDWEFRGSHCGVPCKHQHALRKGLGTFLEG
jgi:SWIM zinc finger